MNANFIWKHPNTRRLSRNQGMMILNLTELEGAKQNKIYRKAPTDDVWSSATTFKGGILSTDNNRKYNWGQLEAYIVYTEFLWHRRQGSRQFNRWKTKKQTDWWKKLSYEKASKLTRKQSVITKWIDFKKNSKQTGLRWTALVLEHRITKLIYSYRTPIRKWIRKNGSYDQRFHWNNAVYIESDGIEPANDATEWEQWPSFRI